MNFIETALALLATYLGISVLGSPFIFYSLGLPLAATMVVCAGLTTLTSFWLLLRTKDLMPQRQQSLYEIAYVLFGRTSIYVICVTIFLRNFGSIVICYMVFGETVSTLIGQAWPGD
mmetsp:Transcript_17529/g.22219  ORF Transcript_17529/g.22219 Transcript_17529/m.22219 type:complete len:117 (-) Transcript_17529:1074-1424(-)